MPFWQSPSSLLDQNLLPLLASVIQHFFLVQQVLRQFQLFFQVFSFLLLPYSFVPLEQQIWLAFQLPSVHHGAVVDPLAVLQADLWAVPQAGKIKGHLLISEGS